jgi:hypothetical protein
MRSSKRFNGLLVRGVMTGAVVLVACGVAVAASSFETGNYKVGNPKTGGGLRMHIGASRFSVKVIRYLEQCRYGNRAFNEYVAFRSGPQNRLDGKVKDNGDFSGRFVYSGGQFKVTGHVEGHKATVKSKESGIYNPASNTQPNECHGSHTFHAALAGG